MITMSEEKPSIKESGSFPIKTVKKTKATKKAIEKMLHRLDQNLLDVMGWDWDEFKQSRVAWNTRDGKTRWAFEIGKKRIGNVLNISQMYESLNILNETIEFLFSEKLKEVREKRAIKQKEQSS